MAIEDHPKYEEWSDAVDTLKKANDRYREARDAGAPNIEVYRLDLHKAREAYENIASEIE